jgi:hypothetical protein
VNPLEAVRHLVALGRQASQTADAWALAVEAYEAGAGLAGVLVAMTGATPTRADDDVTAAVLEVVRMAGDGIANAALVCETLSQAAGGIALNLRGIEGFLAQLHGQKPLREILEGDRSDA